MIKKDCNWNNFQKEIEEDNKRLNEIYRSRNKYYINLNK